MPKLVDRDIFLNAVKEVFGDIDTINRVQITEVVRKTKTPWPNWLTQEKDLRVGWGEYSLTGPRDALDLTVTENDDQLAQAAMAPAAVLSFPSGDTSAAAINAIKMIPSKLKGYVPFGWFSDVRTIIKSGKFYPIYITGLSGNGKTLMVEQVCAVEHREMLRVNITVETDEDDLLGGFRLENGKTVWQDGPVIVAMKKGAILLLDEVDLGSNKLMCLQPILEGKGVFLKKIGVQVDPAPGFNIVATANTKGKGSDDGRFVGTNVMNEAFLERFSITLEQEYPPAKAEHKMLVNILTKAGALDEDFVKRLVDWAELVRKAFAEDAVSDIISTRRLVHICEAFAIFGQDREKAINLCLARFDAETKTAFLELYKKLDETVAPAAAAPASTVRDKSVAF